MSTFRRASYYIGKSHLASRRLITKVSFECFSERVRAARRAYVRRTTAAVFALLVMAGSAQAQEIESPPAPAGTPKAKPYLAVGTINYRLVSPSPPIVGSVQDQADHDSVFQEQSAANDARLKIATDDANYVYARFADALGHTVDRASMPLTVHLLNRAIYDVSRPAFEAKQAVGRPRPFQRFQLLKVCGDGKVPMPEPHPTTGSSYPSGHSAYGWTTALILAQVAPDRAPEILARASEYAESRLICGMHFPSDI